MREILRQVLKTLQFRWNDQKAGIYFSLQSSDYPVKSLGCQNSVLGSFPFLQLCHFSSVLPGTQLILGQTDSLPQETLKDL